MEKLLDLGFVQNPPVDIIHAFIDTNVLLHFRRLEEIDWCCHLAAKQVLLVLAPVVLRELDKHKDSHPQNKLRKRAQHVSADLWSKLAHVNRCTLRENVDLIVIDSDPVIDMAPLRLRADVNDDLLLASMIEWRHAVAGPNVVVVTADSGIGLKARRFDALVVRPPDADRLADEPDGAETELLKLRRELREIKEAQPDLALVFQTGLTLEEVPIPLPKPLTELGFQNKMERLMGRYPRLDDHGRAKRRPSVFDTVVAQSFGHAIFTPRPGPEEIAAYNAALEPFYAAYREYLFADSAYEDQNRRTFPLHLKLRNAGRKPGEDIDVHLRLDVDAAFIREKDLPKAPKEPRPPANPAAPRVQAENIRVTSDYPGIMNPLLYDPKPNVVAFTSDGSETNVAEQHVRYAKHGSAVSLKPLFIRFTSAEAVHSFKLSYELRAGNLPTAVTGSLNVVFVSGPTETLPQR